MKAELTLSKDEVCAMIAANITNTWPCIPGHKWEAVMRYSDEVTVKAVRVDPPADDKAEVDAA